jgi:Do/DeqQ family serine protease
MKTNKGWLLGMALLLTGLGVQAAEPVENAAVQLQNAFTSVSAQAVQAVVVITNKRIERQAMYPQLPPEFQYFFGLPQPDARGQEQPQSNQVPQIAGKGSGIIVRDTGYILTNYHVIKDNDALQVKLFDGRVFDSSRNKEEVVVVGTDKETDLAVLKIGNGKLTGLPFLKFADSEKVKIGEWAIAVGAPFNLDHSVTVGVVSQKGRYDVNMNTYENYIQTDASINPGNSGGPLLNIHGEMIGVNDFIVTGGGSAGSVGLGFSIASNLARQVATQLIENGKVVRPWLGIAMQTLTPELKEQFDVKDGVLVSQVMKGDPADEGGVKAGDVVLKVGDKEVRTPHDLQFAVLAYNPGDKIKLLVNRNGKEKVIHVVARQREGSENVARRGDKADGAGLLEQSGLILENGENGVVIVRVVPGSSAAASGLTRGDVIVAVNRQGVKSVRDVETLLEQGENRIALLYIDRRGSKFYLPLPLQKPE